MLGAAWRWLDAVRRTLVNLVFLLLLGVVLAIFLPIFKIQQSLNQ